MKTGVITPPTWHRLASVKLVHVFGRGTPKFILIGTGLDERIHWLLGWHDGAFHTVFRETVFFRNAALGEETYYRLNYKIVKGSQPRIEARSSYDLVCVTAQPYDFHASWREWLFWNEKDFSFYEQRKQGENAAFSTGWGNDFPFRQKVDLNRVKVLELPPLPQKMWDYDEVEKYWKGIELP